MAGMPKHVEMLYKVALDNLLFIKQHQWRVTNYLMAAYAALAAVAKAIAAESAEKWLLTFIVVVICVYGLLFLNSFIDGLEKFRGRVRWVYDQYFDDKQQKILALDMEKDYLIKEGFIHALMGACIVGALLAVLAIWLPFKS